MKTIEFVEEMHSLGYITNVTKREVCVKDTNGNFCATISKNVLGKFSTEYKGFTKLETQQKLRLLNLLIKYSKTVIEEREEEEEEKYYMRQIGINNSWSFLNFNVETQEYTVANREGDCTYKTQFTQSEIDEMPECYKHPSVWNKVPVLNKEG